MSSTALSAQGRAEPGSSKLQIGRNHPLYVRTERVELLGGVRPLNLLYASDLHLTGDDADSFLIEQIVAAAETRRPDAILLGGDLVDSRNGPPSCAAMVRKLSKFSPVLAVRGHHDQYWGVERSRSAVLEGGGIWLEDRSVLLPRSASAMIRIEGTLTSDTQAGTPRVLCTHDPAVFPKAIAAGYSLVLAGHLHGGQCVLAEHRGRLYPGALIYRYNGLRFHEAGATMIVSRGAADTLPIRWNCPREVIACEIS
jgi:hypothetical protein